MKREDLQLIAVFYFKQHSGLEPDLLRFTFEDDKFGAYVIEVGNGNRIFEIGILLRDDRIELTEKLHRGTFTDAVTLTGFGNYGM